MFNVNVTVTGWALESVAKSNNILRTFGNVGLPLMDKSSSQATPDVWYKACFDMAHYLYFNNDPASDWTLREKAARLSQLIILYLEGRLTRLFDDIVIILHLTICFAAQ
ncbi:uncharacterized protein HD556DRAFT_1312616 [Suillus plorans]|uniref:Uncharacterized protein n=1 Tax=Suillus plorans TaxID=116603 RepID=A0A9P7AG13_9AGAM|nr:uncharacterized protein HD556DRAFT_1312616 [Suillus plorans]KAG1787574.1 hypothetical protein HD556DRAFT_1312616 [Suillus plorans]